MKVTFVFNKKTNKLCEIKYLQDERSLNNVDIFSLYEQFKERFNNRYKELNIQQSDNGSGENVSYDDGITSIFLDAFDNHSMHHPNSYLTLDYELISK